MRTRRVEIVRYDKVVRRFTIVTRHFYGQLRLRNVKSADRLAAINELLKTNVFHDIPHSVFQRVTRTITSYTKIFTINRFEKRAQ